MFYLLISVQQQYSETMRIQSHVSRRLSTPCHSQRKQIFAQIIFGWRSTYILRDERCTFWKFKNKGHPTVVQKNKSCRKTANSRSFITVKAHCSM